jgi:hypothetical protein
MAARTFKFGMARRSLRSSAAAAVAATLLFAACSSADGGGAGTQADDTGPDAGSDIETTIGAEDADASSGAPAIPRQRFRYPPAPTAPEADEQSDADALEAIATIRQFIPTGSLDVAALVSLGETGDVRHAWYLADLLPYVIGVDEQRVVDTFEQLSGVSLADDPESATSPRSSIANHLIAWDTPAYPGYQADKGALFTLLEPAWEPFFADADADIDWRHLSWGGVFIDDRALGDSETCPGGCIPSLDDPATTDAAGGSWYPDDRIVFGLVEGNAALAFPKNIAEIHEMFNFTLADRRFGLPYCTLCGSAQAYYTDNSGADEQPILRTSGLLNRSNKVMYDLVSKSVFDTFTGDAVSGPLQDAGVTLDEATLVRSTWGEWKQAHPETQIIAEDGGIGRSYELDPLDGRDDDGPIFPIGDADARLDVQELVVGVITDDGTPIAFPSAQASSILAEGGEVELGGVRLEPVGGGLRAVDAATGDEIAAHEAFWFAWSQFHPETELFVG